MSSRNQILNDVRANKPGRSVSLPDVALSEGFPDLDLVARFQSEIESSGAVVTHVHGDDDTSIQEALLQSNGGKVNVVAHGVSLDGARSVDSVAAEVDFDDVDLFVCRSNLAVAENGAIWLTDEDCGSRAALFLSEHISIVVSRKNIVPTLHEAYSQLTIDQHGFGIFVAGPSKTADIEQSLVIGAHGPRSLLVILID